MTCGISNKMGWSTDAQSSRKEKALTRQNRSHWDLKEGEGEVSTGEDREDKGKPPHPTEALVELRVCFWELWTRRLTQPCSS